MKRKKTLRSNPKLEAPHLLTPGLEAAMQSYMSRKLKEGYKPKAVKSMTEKKFRRAIEREARTNPSVNLRIKKHSEREMLKNHRWYVRVAYSIYKALRRITFKNLYSS